MQLNINIDATDAKSIQNIVDEVQSMPLANSVDMNVNINLNINKPEDKRKIGFTK